MVLRIFCALPLILVWSLVALSAALPAESIRASLYALYADQNPQCIATSTFSNSSWALVYGRCKTMKAGMFFITAAANWKPADCGLGVKPATGSSPLTHCRLNASSYRLARAVIAQNFSPVSKGLRAASRAGVKQPEVVIRYVADPEIQAVINFGSVRGDRITEHFATNDIYRRKTEAQSQLALPVQPSERLDMLVPFHVFSQPLRVMPKFGQPGGGTERTVKSGRVPVIGIRASPLSAP